MILNFDPEGDEQKSDSNLNIILTLEGGQSMLQVKEAFWHSPDHLHPAAQQAIQGLRASTAAASSPARSPRRMRT